jgi:transcription antitermination factor NusG
MTGETDGVAMCEHKNRDGILTSPEAETEALLEPALAAYPQWFALVVKPRFDKAVARALGVKGYETLVPLYKKYHNYATHSKHHELPLFPGYVCCRFAFHTRLSVLATPGVIRVAGAGRRPIPVSEIEINSLQAAIKAQLPFEPFPFLSVGQKVRINSGVLAGVEGIVLGTRPRLRLVLSITLLQRSVLLEIDRDQVSTEEALNWTVVTC